ncbi:MAG: enoyl-CoA hydratase/isomerase family protein [Ferruginibacter sp.]|nr:enoyl-CoA hydratase/isomerase family protein [Cytophagales bacterium]
MQTTQYQNLRYDSQNGICTLTLNRPQVYNALSTELIEEITDAVRRAGEEEAVRVVVITGAGDKAFCSGADLKQGMGGAQRPNFSERLRTGYNPMILGIRNLGKPVICRLNGIAAGAGCSLALACDLIVASEGASLVELFVNIGLIMDAGSSYFLPRLVGSARAFELCSTGRPVSAREALELGLVNRVVPASGLDEAVDQLTAYYSQAPTIAIGLMKKLLNQSHASTLEQMLELEAACQDIAGNTLDSREGVLAFLEKRKPRFSGQ